MFRATLSALRGSNQYPWSSGSMASYRRRHTIRQQREAKQRQYQEGILKGDNIFGVQLDRREVMREVKGKNINAGRGGRIQSDRHSQQQSLINTRDYEMRNMKRLANGDRQTQKVEALNRYHFPMLK